VASCLQCQTGACLTVAAAFVGLLRPTEEAIRYVEHQRPVRGEDDYGGPVAGPSSLRARWLALICEDGEEERAVNSVQASSPVAYPGVEVRLGGVGGAQGWVHLAVCRIQGRQMESMFDSRRGVLPVYFEVVGQHSRVAVEDESVNEKRYCGVWWWRVVDVAVETTSSGHETGEDAGDAGVIGRSDTARRAGVSKD